MYRGLFDPAAHKGGSLARLMMAHAKRIMGCAFWSHRCRFVRRGGLLVAGTAHKAINDLAFFRLFDVRYWLCRMRFAGDNVPGDGVV